MQPKKLLTLKEASSVTGYSSDYLGQLIRSGKLKGEKVFCQVTWKIDIAELESYKKNNNGVSGITESKKPRQSEIVKLNLRFSAYLNRAKSELLFFRLLLRNIKTILPLITVFLFCFILFSFFALDLIFNTSKYNFYQPKNQNSAAEAVQYSMY
jgi:hypothetical protein